MFIFSSGHLSRYDANVTEPQQVYALVEYIHNNPVIRGLVETATTWKWSSLNDWLGNRLPLIELDRSSMPIINASE